VVLIGTVALTAACTHDDERATVTVTTSWIDTTTYEVRPDMRLAGQICRREAECNALGKPGGWGDPANCVNGLTPRLRSELDGWQCAPAATRARYKDCLADIAADSCATIGFRELQPNICATNALCTD
jgi:hypothetical protein